MTAEGPERPLRLSDWLVAVAVAAVVVALTAVAVVSTHRMDRAGRQREAVEAEAVVATGLGVDLERGLRGVTLVARNVPALGPAAVHGQADSVAPGADDVGFVPPPGDPSSAFGPPPLSPSEQADAEIAAVLDRARDTGAALLGPTVTRDGRSRTTLVSAAYVSSSRPGPPQTTTDRRARLAGWVVATVDLDAIVDAHAPTEAQIEVRDPGASGQLGGSGQVVEVSGRRFVVDETAIADGSVEARTIILALLGGGLAAASAVSVLLRRRRHRAVTAAAAEQAAQVRLIGDVAPLVQQSLELAEVLPSVAVQLSDHFGLAGVALSTGSSRAGQTELFSIGVEPDAGVKPRLQPPAELLPGETLNLALQRGGRSVALLQIVAGRSMDTSELESLRALSELVTAAMVNAALYASQQEALARMRDLDALKTVFLGTASHELRTPATAIAGFAGLLTSSWDRFSDEQRRDFVDRIGANARSLSQVVQDLLDFSLLDRGTLALSVEPLDLGAVVQGVLDRLSPTLGDHGLDADLQPTELVDGDRSGLERITTNLLTNAVKFSPAGTTIGVTVRPDGDHVVLEVRDQGPGVPAEERERVFTRFYRGSGDAVLATRGVGIGLSVVAEFVARMRGEVRVDDAPGGGARFTVRLPLSQPATIEEVVDATAR